MCTHVLTRLPTRILWGQGLGRGQTLSERPDHARKGGTITLGRRQKASCITERRVPGPGQVHARPTAVWILQVRAFRPRVSYGGQRLRGFYTLR